MTVFTYTVAKGQGPIGLQFTGTANDQFTDVIVRKNIVRQVPDNAHGLRTDASGVYVNRSTRTIIENNVLNDTGTAAVGGYSLASVVENCGSAKFFNNQNTAGQLLRGYNKTTSKTTLELEDAVQDVLLSF